ncbi:MAG: magnesium transporter, partial [Rhodobacteraceae bacterium]
MTLANTLAPKARALTAAAMRDWLDRGDLGSIRVALSAQHAADLANVLGAFEAADIARLLATMPVRLQAETFGYFDADLQLALAETLDRRALTAIVAAMSHDERADLFASLSEESRAVLLPGLAKAERDDMLKLSAYEEGTVGSVMTSDYATLPPRLTAPEAVEHLRRAAPDAETIYSAYVLNDDRQLVGAVRLRDLILARAGQTVGDLMQTDPPHIRAGAPREEAVALIAKYDLLALPVINGGDKMVGIVTADDALDVAEAEATIDFHRQASVGEVGASVLKAPLWLLYRARVVWLVLLVFGNI